MLSYIPTDMRGFVGHPGVPCPHPLSPPHQLHSWRNTPNARWTSNAYSLLLRAKSHTSRYPFLNRRFCWSHLTPFSCEMGAVGCLLGARLILLIGYAVISVRSVGYLFPMKPTLSYTEPGAVNRRSNVPASRSIIQYLQNATPRFTVQYSDGHQAIHCA
ncbi:hypothetical protein C8R47DRAFT_748447 [Mycena vitilis]|nr:hypothetical protein C8R47DRAFT_748447 [Mycena vitilis]